ncbi:MAG: hypothetical protein LC676_10870 [Loktanella sp.]|nr:hypothetical protein [Loktanella sp.]
MTFHTQKRSDLIALCGTDPIRLLNAMEAGAGDWAAANLPGHMLPGIARYLILGVRPGSFLCAMLTNDLGATVLRADEANFGRIGLWVKWLHNFAPPRSFGGEAFMQRWVETGGLRGGYEDDGA